jgi:hypothetical protein
LSKGELSAGIVPERASLEMTASGHEDQFPPPSLNDRCRLGEATFAGMGDDELNAPVADLRRATTANRVRYVAQVIQVTVLGVFT